MVKESQGRFQSLSGRRKRKGSSRTRRWFIPMQPCTLLYREARGASGVLRLKV